MKNLCAIVAFSLVMVCTTYAQNKSILEQDLIVDGTSEDFTKQLSRVKKHSSVIGLELNPKQVDQLFKKIAHLKGVHKLEFIQTNLSHLPVQRFTFGIDTLILNTCEDKLAPSFKLPPTQHLVFTNVNDRYILKCLSSNESVSSIELNQCELDQPKTIFKKLEAINPVTLIINDCDLERLPFNIEHCHNLKHLDISGNQIWLMDTTGLYQLQSFICTGNPLEGYMAQKKKIKVMSNGLIQKNADNAMYFQSDHPFLKPPSDHINVVPQSFVVNANEAVTLKTLDKAQFSIPPGCFVDSLGKPVRDQVQVIIREYNNPLSIMVAGIPMFTDTTKGNQHYLVSDGMFEIQAYAKGQKLEIAPGKEIGVNYPSANNSTTNNQLWDLNPNTGTWDNISTRSNFEKPGKRKNNITPALLKYRDLHNYTIAVTDTSGYEYRFMDKWHVGELLVDSGRITKSNSYENFYSSWTHHRFNLQASTVGKGEFEKMVVRVIPITKETRKWANSFRLLNWVIVSSLTEKEKESLLRNTNYSDARFIRNGDKTSLQIKDYTGVHEYQVEPFAYHGEEYYTQRAHKIIDKVNAKIVLDQGKRTPKQNFTVTNRYAFKRHRYLWRMIKPLRNKEEKKMTFHEFHAYANANLLAEQSENVVAYAFRLNKVGMKNIDCQRSLIQPKNITVSTLDNDTINISYVYQPSSNTVINFYGGTTKNKLFAEAGSDTYIVNMSNDEVSYTKISKKEMSKLPDNESVCAHVKEKAEEFQLEKMEEKLKQSILHISPNPTNGIFSVSINNTIPFNVLVYSSSGKLMMSFNQVSNGSPLDVQQLPVGNYIIALKNEDSVLGTGKLIVSR